MTTRAREVEAWLRLAAEALPDHRIQAKREDMALILREAASALSALIAECEGLKETLRKTFGPISTIRLFHPTGDERYPHLHQDLLREIVALVDPAPSHEGCAPPPQPVPVGEEKT